MVKAFAKIVLKEDGQVFGEDGDSPYWHHIIEGPVEYLVQMPSEEREV